MKKKTIAVLGGGSAGLTAARTACEMGARVLFFTGARGQRGSLCIEHGCMPSKALFEPIDAMHRAKRHGWLEVRAPEDYLTKIVAWKDRQISSFRRDREETIGRLQTKNFSLVEFDARFRGKHELETTHDRYAFDRAIIATGSRQVIPPQIHVAVGADGVWTNVEILANTVLPKSLVVVGAGPVALEFSLRYARLGCSVTIVSRSLFLSKFPELFGQRLQEIYESEGIRCLTGHELVSLERAGDGRFRIKTKHDRGTKTVLSERVLLATGRRPQLDALNLPAIGLQPDKEGRLEVGADMRASELENIFVAGDAAGRRMVVHQAHIEAGIAAENAVTDGRCQWERRSNLQVVFSDPEFAFAGRSRAMAEEAGHQVKTATGRSDDVGKLHLAGDDRGFGEFVADARTGRLLGAGLLCDDAANLIHLPAYAIDHDHTVHQLAMSEFYHPTKIELVSQIADTLCRELGGTPFCRARE